MELLKNKGILTVGLLVIALVGFFLFKNTTSENTKEPSTNNQAAATTGYFGKTIAGSISPFLEFNKADFEKAKEEQKIIFLDFYANWCPVCRAEAPVIHSGFDMFESEKIVGFRVNFNDDQTDQDEKDLAKEFNVPYQYTKIIIKDGKEILRSGERWEKADFDEAFSKALQ
ncbi:MAG: thioredoxin family protein [Candidatus Curtissbacteria bacterium]